MLKTIRYELKKFIPSCEKGAEKPTVFWVRPLSKGEYDKYMDSISSTIKRGELQTKRAEALRAIFRNRVEKIENIIIDGQPYEEVTDKDLIVKAILSLENVDAGNELENFILGISTVSENEEKNSE